MQVIFIITLFVLFSFFITAPDVVFDAAKKALFLWADTIVPSMLPFFILNALLNAAGGIELIGKVFRRPVEKLLKLPGEAAFVLASGYSTGVPVSASLIADLRKEGSLSREEANRLLAFSANVSPAFLLSAVSISMLGAKEAGLPLALIHYGTNLILMISLSLFFHAKQDFQREANRKKERKKLSMEILTDAVFHSIRTIFLIGGIILCFFILIAFIDTLGILHRLAALLHLSPQTERIINGVFCGILEITAGSARIAGEEFPFSLRFTLLSAVLAFGGLSAGLQIASAIRQTDLSLGFYLKYKIIQGVLAFTISLQLPFPVRETAALLHSGGFAQTIPSANHIPWGIWCYGIMVALTLIFLIYRHLCAKRKR